MPNLLFLLLFTFFQTLVYKIELGKYYDSHKQDKAQGYEEAFTIKDETGKEQYIISITKVAMPLCSCKRKQIFILLTPQSSAKRLKTTAQLQRLIIVDLSFTKPRAEHVL